MELLLNARHHKGLLAAVLALFLVLWLLWGNKALTVTRLTLLCPGLPEGFRGFRVAHISDLHNDQFGQGNSKLLETLAREQPEAIFITGDLIDSRRTDFQVGLDFTAQAMNIAPVYYVPGNHESRIREYPRFRAELQALGVTVLENRKIQLERNGDHIELLGMQPPEFTTADTEGVLELLHDRAEFQILLNHRPDLLDTYAEYGMDLVFSGHAHGGQIRLPFLGGIIAPNQGYFPKITQGVHTSGKTQLVVSRGLGNSLFPLRVNNRPELVMVTLELE